MSKLARRWLLVLASTLALFGGVAFTAVTSASAATTPLSASAYSNGDSTALWNNVGNLVLTAGKAAGTSAQLQIHGFHGTMLPATEPAFTATPAASAGDPRMVIELHNGQYLFGYGSGAPVATRWDVNPGGPHGVTYAAAKTAAESGGTDNYITTVFIVADAGNAGISYALSGVQFNGQTLAPFAGMGHAVRNVFSGKCLDIKNGLYVSGGTVQQWACGAAFNGVAYANQKFAFASAAGKQVYQAIGGSAPVCVTGVMNNTPTTLQPCAIAANVYNSGGFFHVGTGSLVLDDPAWSTANGVRVNTYTYNGGANQKWVG